jgi:hypothetical protein
MKCAHIFEVRTHFKCAREHRAVEHVPWVVNRDSRAVVKKKINNGLA